MQDRWAAVICTAPITGSKKARISKRSPSPLQETTENAAQMTSHDKRRVGWRLLGLSRAAANFITYLGGCASALGSLARSGSFYPSPHLTDDLEEKSGQSNKARVGIPSSHHHRGHSPQTRAQGGINQSVLFSTAAFLPSPDSDIFSIPGHAVWPSAPSISFPLLTLPTGTLPALVRPWERAAARHVTGCDRRKQQ